MRRITLPFTATPLQASTYLLGVCLFSISFLVFLNSSVSFVITDRIGQKKKVGDAVGTLGFADELVALVACPLWGVLSDRIGVRYVAVAGYTILGISLFVFVQARNVYPELLLGRLLFSVGGAASTTMVTAILPSMTFKKRPDPALPGSQRQAAESPAHVPAPSVSSELTITPRRYNSRDGSGSEHESESRGNPTASSLAGIVGMLTGCGALVALGLFLPLPTRFQNTGKSPSEAIADSFYVVGAIALLVAIFCLFGLHGLAGEEGKGLGRVIKRVGSEAIVQKPPLPSYVRLISTSIKLGFQDTHIGLGYIGGFVARASSVAISTFIPLFVNAYFLHAGLCPEDPDESAQDPNVIKKNCQRAYIVASILSGVSQLVALLCAPIFGYLSGLYKQSNIPLLLAAASGVAGYATFGRLKSPDFSSKDGSAGVFFIVALLGISQIGAIVCSLGLLARGIEHEVEEPAGGDYFSVPTEDRAERNTATVDQNDASTPLMPNRFRSISEVSISRVALKGSIAGVYSLAGGAGILLLTKVGGLLFDQADVGAPFFLMAAFNAILFLVTLGSDVGRFWKATRRASSLPAASLDNGGYRDEG